MKKRHDKALKSLARPFRCLPELFVRLELAKLLLEGEVARLRSPLDLESRPHLAVAVDDRVLDDLW